MKNKFNQYNKIIDLKNDIVITDNFSTKDILSTGSSNSLNEYIPFYDSTVVSKLKKAKFKLGAKANIDEFGINEKGLNALDGPVINPIDKERVVGGASSGLAVSIKIGDFEFGIGSDTDGGVRIPASYLGLKAYKPTYGLVSRFGMFSSAPSLETPSIIAKDIKKLSKIGNIIKGLDKYDMNTFDSFEIDLEKNLDKDISGRKMFYIKELLDEDVADIFNEKITKLKEKGIEINEISLDELIIKSISIIHKVILSAELTSSISNLTGIIFGKRQEGNTIDEIIQNFRTNNFTFLTKEKLTIGSYVLYEKNQERTLLSAAKMRKVITDKFNELFSIYDAMIMPICAASLISDKSEQKSLHHLLIANLGGYPSVITNLGKVENMPVGLSITGDIKKDAIILNIANKINEGETI